MRGVVAIDKGHLIAGRYRLLEHVGSGSMGIVWQARDERLDRTVAIKQLLVRPGRTEEQAEQARRRAMREARIAARLQHRNAVVVYDVAEHEGDPCLVLEYLPSRSLSAVIKDRGALSPQETADIGSEVATALAAAHAAGIVHRDVKPGNILIGAAKVSKITDFGIARAIDDGTVTQSTGTLAGTPAYLAPEVARGQEPNRASDVFSLGATLYEVVEGTPPFGRNDNPLALLYAVAGGQIAPPTKAGPLTPILMSLLRTDPAERPAMDQAAIALAEVAAGTAVAPLPPRVGTRVMQPAAQQPPHQPTMQRPAPQRQAPPPVQQAMPSGPVPVQRPPAPARKGVLVAAAIVVAMLAGIVTVLIVVGQDDQAQGGNAAASPSQAPSSTASQPPVTTTTGSSPPAPVQANGKINYTAAGELVIDYYNGRKDPAGMWAKLSPGQQAAFGGVDAFNQYWATYTQLSARNARGVTANPDGSVSVPVDVTYGGAGGPRQEHKSMRVVISPTGGLLIDSDAH